MTKIAYNACFGGFGLSEEGIEYYAKVKNIILYKNITHKYGITTLYYTSPDFQSETRFYEGEISRTDPHLIQTIEDLGPKANGNYANLKISELPPRHPLSHRRI